MANISITESEADLIMKCLNEQEDKFDWSDRALADNVFGKFRRAFQ